VATPTSRPGRPERHPTVLFIGGTGRSGSTLLELMLGQVDGVFAAGEVTYLWERGLEENQLCGCGRPLRECEFWGRVLEAAFARGEVPVGALAEARRSLCRLSNLPRLAIPRLQTPVFRSRVEDYTNALVRVYRAIADASGCGVVTDSSKYPPEALLLEATHGIDLRVVHLVRDSVAVAHAWRRWKIRPEIHWKREYMPRYPYVQTALAWDLFNGLFEGMRRRGVPTLRLRYEDMVAAPRPALERVCEFIGKPRASLEFLRDGGLSLDPNHTCSGNPLRFERGPLPIEPSVEWRDETPRARRWLVEALTYPYRRRYGYAASSSRE